MVPHREWALLALLVADPATCWLPEAHFLVKAPFTHPFGPGSVV